MFSASSLATLVWQATESDPSFLPNLPRFMRTPDRGQGGVGLILAITLSDRRLIGHVLNGQHDGKGSARIQFTANHNVATIHI